MKFLSCLNKAVEWVATLILAIVLALVILQVFYRYVMNDPISWTQELSVYGTIIVVMLGTALAFRQNEHIAVTFFVDLFPLPIRRLLTGLANLISMAFLAMLAYESWQLAMRAMRQISPTTGLPNGLIILFVFAGSGLSCLYLIPRLMRPTLHSVEDEVQAEINANQ